MDNLARLIRQFEASEEASQAGRREAERARDYYDGKQLTDEERKALRRRKQPPVIINRIQRKIDYLRGLERQNRTDPKAYPRTIRDEQDAGVVTDVLRYVDRDQQVDMKRSLIFENIMIEGFGGVEVTAKQTRTGTAPCRTLLSATLLKPEASQHPTGPYGEAGDKRKWPHSPE